MESRPVSAVEGAVILDVATLEVGSDSTEALHPGGYHQRHEGRRHSEVRTRSNGPSSREDPSGDHRRRSSVIVTLNNFVAASKPRQSLQTYLEHQQGNHSLLETYINRSFYLGLSPFRIQFHPGTAHPEFVTFRRAQFLFLVWNLLALLHDFGQLRLLTFSYDQFKRHPKMVYVFLGYRAVLTFMRFRYFQLLWWKRYKFTNLLASFRKADLITVRPLWTSIFPTVILLTSGIFSLVGVVGGFNQLTEAASWTPWYVLTRYRNDLWIATVGPSNDNSTYFLLSSMSSAQVTLTTALGGLGAFIDFVTELLHFCSLDVFFLSTVTIWMLARELEVEHLPRGMFRPMHRQQTQVMLISREINEIVKLFLPPLTTATVISITYLIHLLLQQRWFMAFYVAVKLSKPCIAYILALKITDKIEDYKFWFFGPEVQEELNLDAKEVQIKILEFAGLPIGIGQGPFYVDVRFMASFIGIISTYFFLIREGFGFGSAEG